jgi:hypothetical protein
MRNRTCRRPLMVPPNDFQIVENVSFGTSSHFSFLPSADYKVVCRRPWNHFLTLPPSTPPDFIEIGYSKVSYDTFLD